MSLTVRSYGAGPRTALAVHGITASSAAWPAVARALGDVARLTRGGSIQARCLECGGFGATASASDTRLLDLILARIGL